MIENIEQLVGGSDRGALFAALGQMTKALTPEATIADSQAWLAFLRGREDVRERPIGTVGYCMGGRLSQHTSSRARLPSAPDRGR